MATKKSNLKILFIVLAVAVVGVVAFKFFGKSKGETAGDSDDAETDGNTRKKSTTQKITKKSVTVEADESELDELCEKFIKTCNDYGNSATAYKHPWDTTTLKTIMALPKDDLVRLNSMFKAAAACTYSDNYGAVKSKYYTRTSLSDAIPAGTRCKYRTGASTAFAFKEKMEALGL
ncbi:MAG: hypothetical protein ACI3ZV_01715 [Paludibacteraceae bacterium]